MTDYSDGASVRGRRSEPQLTCLLCLGERGGRVGRAHEEEVDLLPVPTWAKAANIGDFGTGCRKQYALPLVSERLRGSSGVRGAARSPARPPQAAAQLCQRELWHYRDGTLAMLPVRARARRLAALVHQRRAEGPLEGREAIDLGCAGEAETKAAHGDDHLGAAWRVGVVVVPEGRLVRSWG